MDLGQLPLWLMEHPEALGESGPMVRHQTLLSEVFVGQDRVYKFKRPVSPGFIDQTDLATRWALCRHEVQLNRRFSRGVYLGVSGFGLETQKLEAEAVEGEPCVVMTRLANADRLAEHLKGEAPPLHWIEPVAHGMADFHGECERAEPGLHDLGARLRENLEVLGTLPRVDSVWRTRVMDYFEGRRPLVEKREAAGRILDGHGDLRPDHLYLVDGRLQVLDCVEFSPAIRAVDPFEDLAFTSMGARLMGQEEWARRLVLEYCASAADVEGFALLPLYEMYRATVRAKVSLLLAREGDHPRAESHRARVDSYLDFAESVLTGGRAQGVRKIVVVAGMPATGKSTYAAELGRAQYLPVLSTDVLRKRSLSLKPHQRAAADAYSPESKARVYQRCAEQADALIRSGYGLILDGTFSKSSQRKKLVALAEDAGCAIEFHEVTASEDQIRGRLAQRGEGASDLRDYETWLKVQKEFQPMQEDGLPGYRRVQSET